MRPFHTWSVDLITDMKPPGANGEVYGMVAVDATTKWVEIGGLADKNSKIVERWFHANVTCCFGTPAIVRCDQGNEWKGAFAEYLEGIGARLMPVFTAHPRANG